MNKLAIVLVPLVFAASMSGCAMKTVYDIDSGITGSVGGTSLIVEDNRPNEEKEKSYGSFIVGRSNYGIWTLGDESFKPTPMEALRQRVLQSAAVKRQYAPKEIRINVKHLVVQDNQQAYLLRDGSSSLGPLGVTIAEAMQGKKFEMDYDKTKPFVIAFLDAEVSVDGHTRSIMLSKANNYQSNVDTEGREKATRVTVEQFFGEVGSVVIGR